MINTPGTPAAVATALDGYPLILKGEAGKGLGFSLIASTIGGIFGVLILILFAVPLDKLAISFHPADYFALAVFWTNHSWLLVKRQSWQGNGGSFIRTAD